MNQPNAFLNQPGYGSHLPPPAPPQQTEDPRAEYARRTEPVLRVEEDGYVYLNAEAARLLPKNDNTIDLRSPVREGRGDAWHLDARAGGRFARRPVGTSGGVKFRAAALVRLMLGCQSGGLSFELEHVGNGLFRLFPKTGNK